MKIKTVITSIAFLIFLNISHTKAQTVYITESGKKYHAKNCDIAKTGKKGIELSEAKKQGYEPCKVCKVTTEQKVADKPKESKTSKK